MNKPSYVNFGPMQESLLYLVIQRSCDSQRIPSRSYAYVEHLLLFTASIYQERPFPKFKLVILWCLSSCYTRTVQVNTIH